MKVEAETEVMLPGAARSRDVSPLKLAGTGLCQNLDARLSALKLQEDKSLLL